ncbi:MAG: hypothetical protein FD139_39 [Methylocystaceae bacterium]|nr:MAG: hypothetical protein FD148_463 [Methylocystaceae bacterium]KAF0208592.1 MAG: hypothetical protein FD172_3408 [Methylocystaceae bacterium]TXT48429.1 MAG: hypothetical protein FD139_39 [Methylocystaceae bacterium]
MPWFTFEIFRKGEAPVGRIVDQTLGPLLGPTGSQMAENKAENVYQKSMSSR